MKFLHVKGDDYAALIFEDEYNPQEVYEKMVSVGEDEMELDDINVKIVDLNIDRNALSYIKENLCDYDQLKSENIFEVEEK